MARIRAVDDSVQAWAFLDPDHALGAGGAADGGCRAEAARTAARRARRDEGHHRHRRHADRERVAVHAGRGRRPGTPPWCRCSAAAGAVIMGKTVTTEFATSPGKTRNPHNPAHTPGGSSSGSAAAVAAGTWCRSRIGSQTNGSVIRPAAYCGVYGFKPTHGLIRATACRPLALSRHAGRSSPAARRHRARSPSSLVGFDERDPDPGPGRASRVPRRGGRGAADLAAARVRQDACTVAAGR